jgi:hypothetical protein
MKSKRLSLRKEIVGELRSDELAQVAGGSWETCTICITLGTCHPTICFFSLKPPCFPTLEHSCLC